MKDLILLLMRQSKRDLLLGVLLGLVTGASGALLVASINDALGDGDASWWVLALWLFAEEIVIA